MTLFSIVILFSVTAFTSIQAQDAFIDSRDGTAYPLIKIANQTWFATDLKYISPNAYFQSMDSLTTKGNFYYWEESTKVCPEGWRLSSRKDWALFALTVVQQMSLKASNGIDKIEAFEYNNIHKLAAVIQSNSSFFKSNTPLNIIPTGRIENGQPDYGNDFIDYWATTNQTKHHYYHIHISNNILAGHSHKHNIALHSKKRRMFKIRCVQED